MKRVALLVVIWLATSAQAGLEDAVVRIHSHGCSGTVIATKRGWSCILTCAHAFVGADAARPIRMDSVEQTHAAKPRAAVVVLVAIDYDADLALIEADNGPYWCVPLAPANRDVSRRVLSVGFDEMRWPATIRQTEVIGDDGRTFFTRDPPWHGRSGGALFDPKNEWLIGVVQGYEVGGQHRGIYRSLAEIHSFIKRRPSPKRPQAVPQRQARPSCPT